MKQESDVRTNKQVKLDNPTSNQTNETINLDNEEQASEAGANQLVTKQMKQLT